MKAFDLNHYDTILIDNTFNTSQFYFTIPFYNWAVKYAPLQDQLWSSEITSLL